MLSLYILFALHSFPENQPKPSSAVCLQLPGLQCPVGNTRSLSSVLKPKASCWCYFCFLEALWCPCSDFFFFFSPPLCAISWPKEKYFTGVVSGAEYEVHFKFPFVFLCIFFYYCCPTNRVKGFILVKGSDLAGMKLPHRHFSISLWCQPWYTALKSRGELFFSWLSCTEKQSHHHTSYRDLLALDQAGIYTKS